MKQGVPKTFFIGITCLLGLTSCGFSQVMEGIKPASNEPVLNTASNVNLYSHLPKQIITWDQSQSGIWVKDSVETDEYDISSGHVVTQISRVVTTDNDHVEYDRYQYKWKDNLLVETDEFLKKGDRADSSYSQIRRTLFYYENRKVDRIDVYDAGALSDEYLINYDKEGRICKYEHFIYSAFTYKLALSSRSLYTYDDRNRVSKIVTESPRLSTDVTTVQYVLDGALVTSHDGTTRITYNSAGQVVFQLGEYPEGQNRYHRVDLAYDNQGRLIRYTSRYYDSKDNPNIGTAGDLRYDLSY